jgi:hypothetical protein
MLGMTIVREKVTATLWGIATTAVLGGMIVVGSRNLDHFDAALVGYTFATLFAVFGITYRYAMWLQRPPTRLYWRRGWQMFLRPGFIGRNLVDLGKRFFVEFAFNRFILRRGTMRWGAHWLIMWGCIVAFGITFPLVWGWVHFETTPEDINVYQVYLFGFPGQTFHVESLFGFIVFHGLVWASFLVIAGVMLAFRRRMIDHGAAAVQQFGEDILPLLLLFAISVTGLMLTASYSWMKGYAYDFLAILHAVTVILWLLYLPFGKFFHIFQRPAQLGVSFYKDVNANTEQAECARCGRKYMSLMWQTDLAAVEHQLGFDYSVSGKAGIQHYQQVCPKCRRALFGLAQGAMWRQHLSHRVDPASARQN